MKNNYSYEGQILQGYPNGKGVFTFENGDKYVGECLIGKLDGFGKYYYTSGATYTGFFSYNRMHGIGTYEDLNNIYKGQWRNDKKHGLFHRTKKKTHETFRQLWRSNKQMSSEKIHYIQPAALHTSKKHPRKTKKVFQKSFRGNFKECITCLENPVNSTNINCGHAVICYDCWKKCDRCPICRSPVDKIIKLFVS